MSEGGMAVAVAEMCIAGGLGATLIGDFDEVDWFSESNCRFVIEVEPERIAEFESLCEGFPPIYRVGTVISEPVLSFGDLFSVSVSELKDAWQKPLDW
jgi:phosphoribosylformylglycinamidine synthase